MQLRLYHIHIRSTLTYILTMQLDHYTCFGKSLRSSEYQVPRVCLTALSVKCEGEESQADTNLASCYFGPGFLGAFAVAAEVDD